MKPALTFTAGLTLLLGLGSALADDTSSVTFTGTAMDADRDKELYREHHEVSGQCQEGVWQPGSHEVNYTRPGESEPFARKTLDYGESVIRPAMDFRQPDFDERLRIDYPTADVLRIDWTAPEGERERFELEISERLVVDAGFDHFIRRHWSALTAGESREFDFLAPTRGETFGFVAEPAGNGSGIDARHVLQIRPTGLLARMLVDPIVLGYNGDGFLTHYEGLGNVRRNPDDNYVVSLRYQTPDFPRCELTP